ncbi:MAG: tetratricopeptide repeat protein [Promethearchaeota archaeon]|nr:MAG: tetratricopeptide repeat protein [Candidatus Lokiarchaeota archaeon]
MKASILKKLNLIIEEANAFKDKNNFQKALKKFQEALDFISNNVKEEEEKNTEVENIKNAINQTYSVQVDNVVQGAIRLTAQKKFDKAKEEFQNALKLVENIDEPNLKLAETEEINKLISENEIEYLLTNGLILKSKNQLTEAVEMFKEGLRIAEEIYESDFRNEALIRIKNEIAMIYESQIDEIVEKGKDLKKSGQIESAINTFEEALSTIEKYFDPKSKSTQIKAIKNLSNEIYSNQIKPLTDKGKELLKQNSTEQAISKLKEALSLANKMYDSDLKNLEISLIAEVLNPIYIERINPLVEKGKEITKQEKFEESITSVNEAVDNFNQAFDIIKNMAQSKKKEIKFKEVSDLINSTCTAGINVIKENSIQYIVQKKYEQAISDLYIALSLAKRMVYPEEENPELDNLKNLVNKVYFAEVSEVVIKADKLVEQKKYEKAIETYNKALVMTNKMYLTDEMEKEVGKIKSQIYETEIKQLVGKGDLAEEQKLKEREIEKLKKRLDYAQSIDDPERRVAEMTKIKKLIDEVHSEEIKLLIEQGNQLADLKKYDDAFKFYENALKVNEMMESPDVKNKDLIKTSYKNELINRANFELENKNYDNAIQHCRRALDLDDIFVEAYYHLGLAYHLKKKYDAAIENFQRAVDFNEKHINSWKCMGLSYEAKEDYDKALNNLNKSVEIDSNFADGWYNLGNVYKLRKEFDKAIESYNKATEINPEFAKAWFFMGSAYFDKKDYNNTIKNLEKAIKIDPNLGKDVNPLIKDIKSKIEKLQETLSMSFINR